VPFGPKGAPAYFQQQMQYTVFPDMSQTILEIYLDDIITWASDDQELVDNLHKIFQRLREKNITLNPEKCKLGLNEIEYVGHVINEDGLTFSKQKLSKVADFQLPQSHKSLKGFLGLASYFRTHVKNLALLAQPLQTLITPYKPRKRLEWTNESISQFRQLQNAVINCPKIYFLQEELPIFVQTDASNYGIGAYLFQKSINASTDKTVELPIAFLSKTLNKTQLRWSTYEKEAYAIFFALTKWEHYLRDVHFTLQTDHKNLTYLNVELKQKVQRWKLAIQEYDFDIEHIPGRNNVVADGLSRYCEMPSETEQIVQLNQISAELLEAHRADIQQDNDNLPDNFLFIPEEMFSLIDNKYIDRIPDDIYNVITRVHNSRIGHFGIEKTLQKFNTLVSSEEQLSAYQDLKYKRKYISDFIRSCPCCQKMALLKTPIQTKSYTTATYGLWDQIAIDTIGPLPESAQGHKHVIVFIDTFSRFIELIPIHDLTAETAATALIQIMGRYGIPHTVLTDNGTQFANKIMDQLNTMLEIEHHKIHAYSHEENSIVERANKEIMRHLRDIIYDTRIFANWYKYLPFVQRIKNSEIHISTGVAPAQLVFGSQIDLNRGILTPYIKPKGQLSLFIANSIANQNLAIKVAQETQYETDAKHFERASKRQRNETQFQINSFVLVQHEQRDGIRPHAPPSKLHPTLKGPYKVIAKNEREQGTVYTCQNLVNNKLEDFHVTNLQPFYYDERVVNPTEVALADNESFLVEKIMSHRFTDSQRKIKSNLQFLVKWINIPEPTWEPWKSTNKLNKVHEYLRSKSDLKKFTPK
jgi:hypothetical protein